MGKDNIIDFNKYLNQKKLDDYLIKSGKVTKRSSSRNLFGVTVGEIYDFRTASEAFYEGLRNILINTYFDKFAEKNDIIYNYIYSIEQQSNLTADETQDRIFSETRVLNLLDYNKNLKIKEKSKDVTDVLNADFNIDNINKEVNYYIGICSEYDIRRYNRHYDTEIDLSLIDNVKE